MHKLTSKNQTSVLGIDMEIAGNLEYNAAGDVSGWLEGAWLQPDDGMMGLTRGCTLTLTGQND